VSLLAAKLEYSVALGAFMIGAIMAEAREAGKIEILIGPLRDMFSAVFFVAVGMLIDPRLLIQYAWPIALVTVAVVLVKVPTCAAGAFLAGNDVRTSLRAGMGLAQIGEFSFIIAQLGVTLGVTSKFLYPVVVMVSAVTTLLTPYLIKSSDGVANLFERVAPNTMLGYLDTYHGWVRRLGSEAGTRTKIRRMIRARALQIGLNVALISAILIAGKSLSQWAERRGWALPAWSGGPRAVVWLGAMLLALPMLVATLRKMRAVAQVLAELTITRAEAREHATVTRNVAANAILIPAVLALGAWVLALSAALLPPWPVLVALLAIIAAVAATMWKRFVRMYAGAQIALRTTLTQEHPSRESSSAAPPHALHPALGDAHVEVLTIDPGSPAAGRLIRELQLRSATGASAVGIERDGQSLINPGPDEELQPGDRVLLLGHPKQLAAARRLLETPAGSA
jgi:CPA2 family monovalent cation:H+ antiporter-2